MENASISVLRAFGLKCTGTAKHKAGFTCRTTNGAYSLLRVPLAPDCIRFRHSVKEHLYNAGFTGISRLLVSDTGEPFAVYDNEAYIVTRHLPHREARLSDSAEFLRVIQATARMHALCRGKQHDSTPVPPRPAQDVYRTHADALSVCKRRILKKGKYAELDILFLRSFDAHMADLANWLDLAETQAYAAQLQAAFDGFYVCHGLLKEENILISPAGAITFRNFAECGYGHTIIDLATLIKRYIKAAPPNLLPLEQVLSAYAAECPLDDGARLFLHAALLFPDKYLKLCAKYYDRNRTWTPGAFISRMEAILQNREACLAYISGGVPPLSQE